MSNDWPAILDRSAALIRSYDTGVTLRQLYEDALAPYWDPDAYARVRYLEDAERAELGGAA